MERYPTPADMKPISGIYEELGVPPHLQMHMLRVAAVVLLISRRWHGPPLDENKLVRTCLTHDLGNLVKMPPDEDPFIAGKQTSYLKRFGKDHAQASQILAQEQGLTEPELRLMSEHEFIHNDKTAQSTDYTRKVAAYADQRVAPEGVLPLRERLQEGKERYESRPDTPLNNPKTNEMIKHASAIEDQVMRYCTLTPADITKAAIAPLIKELRSYSI